MRNCLEQFWTDQDLERDPRSISEKEFPVHGCASEKLRFLLNYAILAPSSRNSQPWIWRETIETLHLYADKNCLLPASDPNDREKLIGCGAALSFLVVAMRYFGCEPRVDRFPDGDDPNYLASVTLTGSHVPTDEDRALFAAIAKRHTNRGVFGEDEVPTEVQNELEMDAAEAGVWLHLARDPAKRQELLEIIACGDLEQWRGADFATEMGHWVHGEDSPAKSGIPVRALGYNKLEGRLLPLAMRVPLIGRLVHLEDVQADRDWFRAGAAPILAILGTNETRDADHDWLAVGEALGKVLLRSASAGLAASFFNSPVAVHHLWPKIYHIIGRRGFIHLIFRLGSPLEPSVATPRRPVAEVLRP